MRPAAWNGRVFGHHRCVFPQCATWIGEPEADQRLVGQARRERSIPGGRAAAYMRRGTKPYSTGVAGRFETKGLRDPHRGFVRKPRLEPMSQCARWKHG